jgi:hypothetical protein
MARAAETGQPYQTSLDPPPVDLATSEASPATVTPLRPRTERPATERPAEPLPEETPTLPRVAEERPTYATEPPASHASEPEEETNGAAQPVSMEGSPSPTGIPQRQISDEPTDDPVEHPAPDAPNPYTTALALHACVPDGEKVERDVLLADAAHELGYPNLTKKVRRALNKALNAEHNAGRLRTDWQRVWRPRK